MTGRMLHKAPQTQSSSDLLYRASLILMDLSWAFFHRVVFHFVWAFVYIIFAILLAVGAFVHARILLSGLGLGKRGHVAGGFCCTLAEVGKCWLIATCRTWQCPM